VQTIPRQSGPRPPSWPRPRSPRQGPRQRGPTRSLTRLSTAPVPPALDRVAARVVPTGGRGSPACLPIKRMRMACRSETRPSCHGPESF
jgi:hypothetical protein